MGHKTIRLALSDRKVISTILVLLWSQLLLSQTAVPDATAEAENGALSGGVTVASSIAGYSGTGYVTNFTTTAAKVAVTMTVATKGFYKLVVRYQSEYKVQDLYVNGKGPSSLVLPNSAVFTDVDAGKYLLDAGANTFTIQSNWGWSQIDKFSLYAVSRNVYNIAPNLVNPNANNAAKALYGYMLSKFNVRIISGQTSDWYDKIKPIAGKTPLLRAFDFQHYTQGYPYLWDNNTNGHKFGAEDNGEVQKAIDWYNQTGKVGIVSFQWHWHSPGGGQAGTNTFYTNSTTFDITKAVQPGTTEYTSIMQDIDTIAYQLKRLQSAGVPVLWRPLHEAGGGWFWWGAKGATACKKLYGILYSRLTNYHSINNLIWVWSTPETEWYPKNDSVDIVGYDSYPGVYNYDPQKTMFDKLYELTGGTKLIAMTENGPIPNPDDCLLYDAPWAYFMSWSDLVTAQNTNQHIIDAYHNANVLTIENPTEVKTTSMVAEPKYRIFPNPACEKVQIGGDSFTRLELLDMKGRVVLATTQPISEIDIRRFGNGVYLLKIYDNSQAYLVKLLICK